MNKIESISSALKRTEQLPEEKSIRRFGVLLPLYQKNDEINIIFEVRASKLRRQPGEICFPGGSTEKGENSIEAALRETSEELLIGRDKIRVIYELEEFEIYSGGLLKPVIGLISDYDFTFSKAEVSEVFMVPLDFFLKNEPEFFDISMKSIPEEKFPFDRLPGGKDYTFFMGHRDVCFYEYNGYNIWGLTADITFDFINLLKRGGYPF